MPPQGAAYNVDWVLSNTSNVHVATDRAWFTEYIPFRTKFATMLGVEASTEVHGVGTVVLPTRTYGEGKAHKPSREITLHNVLYAPSGTVNVFAMLVEPDLSFSNNFGEEQPILKRGTNKVLGLVVSLKLFKLWLKGQRKSQSSLNPDAMYYVHATWPAEEHLRYKKYIEETQTSHANNAGQNANATSSAPLTTEEKAFLRKHYGNEFKFLSTLQLSIYKEDDREEGRRILRAFMLESEDDTDADISSVEDPDDDPESDESNDFLAELEQDPTSHLADYKFDEDQLDFVKKHYGHSGNFMRSYGLNPFDDDDCDEAVSIVKAFMTDD